MTYLTERGKEIQRNKTKIFVSKAKYSLKDIKNNNVKRCKCGEIIEEKYTMCYNCLLNKLYHKSK